MSAQTRPCQMLCFTHFAWHALPYIPAPLPGQGRPRQAHLRHTAVHDTRNPSRASRPATRCMPPPVSVCRGRAYPLRGVPGCREGR
jgi:hypothetical protein